MARRRGELGVNEVRFGISEGREGKGKGEAQGCVPCATGSAVAGCLKKGGRGGKKKGPHRRWVLWMTLGVALSYRSGKKKERKKKKEKGGGTGRR